MAGTVHQAGATKIYTKQQLTDTWAENTLLFPASVVRRSAGQIESLMVSESYAGGSPKGRREYLHKHWIKLTYTPDGGAETAFWVGNIEDARDMEEAEAVVWIAVSLEAQLQRIDLIRTYAEAAQGDCVSVHNLRFNEYMDRGAPVHVFVEPQIVHAHAVPLRRLRIGANQVNALELRLKTDGDPHHRLRLFHVPRVLDVPDPERGLRAAVRGVGELDPMLVQILAPAFRAAPGVGLAHHQRLNLPGAPAHNRGREQQRILRPRVGELLLRVDLRRARLVNRSSHTSLRSITDHNRPLDTDSHRSGPIPRKAFGLKIAMMPLLLSVFICENPCLLFMVLFPTRA